VSEELITVTC